MPEPKSIQWLFPPGILAPEKTGISGQRPPQQSFLKVSRDINIPPLFTWTTSGWFHLCKAKLKLTSMAAAIAGVKSDKCVRHPAHPCSVYHRRMPRPLAASNVGSALDRLYVWCGFSLSVTPITMRNVFRRSGVLQITYDIVTPVMVLMIYMDVLSSGWWSQKCKSYKAVNGVNPWIEWGVRITLLGLVSWGFSAILHLHSPKRADHPTRDCCACSGIKHLLPNFPFKLFVLHMFRPTKFKTFRRSVPITAPGHCTSWKSSLPRCCCDWWTCAPVLAPDGSPCHWLGEGATTISSCGARKGQTNVLAPGHILQIVHVVVGFVSIFMMDLPRDWVRRTQESKGHQPVHIKAIPLEENLVVSTWAEMPKRNNSMWIAVPSVRTDLPTSVHPLALKQSDRKTCVAQSLPSTFAMKEHPPSSQR